MKEETIKTGFWKRFGSGLLNSIKAIYRGEFLLRLNVSRYFIHILYLFLMFAFVIWASLSIETTLSKVEKNKAKLKELETIHSAKTFEVVALSRRSTVEKMLKDLDSKVSEAEKPATLLVK